MGTQENPDKLDADFYELCLADINGIRRCHTFTKRHLPGLLSHGFAFPQAVITLPCHTDFPPAESAHNLVCELTAMPDPKSFKLLPWKQNTVHALVDLLDESGEAARTCPRAILRRALQKLKQELNYDLTIGFETEFLLLDKKNIRNGIPLPSSERYYASQNDMIEHGEVLEEMVSSLEQMGIDVVHFHSESAFGQYEIVTGPGDPLTVCDNLLVTRMAIVAIAHKHGYQACFLPKLTDDAGTGCHLNMSLSRNGVDVNQGSEPRTLSAEVQHFIGGILKRQAGLLVWTTGTRNSFERLQPSNLSAAYNVWGVNNREASIRVVFPLRNELNTVHFEQKCFDATTNPHIGVAAVAMAGMLGKKRTLGTSIL